MRSAQARAVARRSASGQTVLLNAAESISAAPYVSCDTTRPANPSYPTEPPAPYARPDNWTGTITATYEYWNGSTFSATCPSAADFAAAPYGSLALQRITISVLTNSVVTNAFADPSKALPPSTSTRTLTVLKRGT